MAKAQLEAGPDFAEPMDFGDWVFNDDDEDYNNEVEPGGPLHHQWAHTAWQEQLPALVDNYLAWKHSHLQEDHNNPAPHSIFHVTAVRISEYTPSIAIQQCVDKPANSFLLHIGFLGCSLLQPTIAIWLECLELYHQI
ncbi:uncharacterized protein BJ212DRAFT_1297955 [Suillus subaureus]|uniref:Uncharacterized protein n=1 Tax=Suillus subaureus TaxID=48587 RepID=A0A9P7JGC3_9AGAM|nr:uncharacterized protein BJ212DRAFT_1297955 [Suillus subaureus]KAG1820593.1 hypothetical protein BJ212DRAFT_1297955 [Suillus subaureus]